MGKMSKYGFWTHKNSMSIFCSWGDTGDDDSEENQEEVRENSCLMQRVGSLGEGNFLPHRAVKIKVYL